jgi:MtN3 and saliva related transmembrane protein
MEKIVGIISGMLTSASMLPQFFKLIKKKDSRDISILMLVVLIAGVSCWVWYGFLKNDLIIIITNAFSVLLNILTLAFALKYRQR